MRHSSYGICREGLPCIAALAFTTLIFALLSWEAVAVVFLGLTLFTLNFFRDPERISPMDQNVAVAPADGKIVAIKTATNPLSGEPRTQVCIFMNVFNVHVNRMPVAATIREIRYFPGLFINASLDKASTDNERNALILEDREGQTWCMVQIAGLIARRIVSWAEVGDALPLGARFGMIKFGSRVDLYIPDEYTPAVRIGDKVLAGQTIVARKK